MAYTSGSLPSGQLEIGIALVLQDRFSNQAREASSAIKGLHRDAKNAVMANLNTIQAYSNISTSIADSLAASLVNTIQEGASFIDTMVSVGAISGATAEDMKNLSDISQTLGMRTMFMSKDIASGMKYLAMAGNNAKEIQDMISGAAMMANATGIELGGKGGAADLLTNIMRTFKLEGQNAANIVGDQLTKATMASNISMSDLAESIKYSAASMVTLKQQLPQVAAMIGTLGNAGIQGSMAGTSIRNMADYLTQSITNPNFKGFKALADLGLSKADFVDNNGDLLDFAVILGKINDAAQGLSTIEQNAIYKSIFGVRGMRAAIAIMRDTEGYFDLLRQIQNESSGFAEDVVGKRMDSLAGKIDIVQSALENVRTTFAQAVEKNPIIMGTLDLVGKALAGIREILATPLGPWIAGLYVVITSLWKVANAIVNWRTKWLVLNGDTQVTFRSMIRLLIGGWNSATISAQGYLNMERAILAQRKAGIKGKMADITGSVLSAGGGRYRDPVTGRFMSKKAAQEAMKNSTPGSLTRTLLGRGAAGAAGGLAGRVAGNAAGGAARGALASVGSKLLGFGSKFLGFLGGPLGMALTGLSIFVPMIYGALKGNKDSNDENTKSINTLSDFIKQSREGFKPKEVDNNRLQIEEMRWLVQALGYYASVIQKNATRGQTITINMDGKKVFEEYIDERESARNVALGLK